ncbi:MAG: hypothetical protein BHW55_01685 [Candidatus Melainabacteria bacterium 35_41]|jgi:DNA gyrase, B subunit|nr:MAG: hypothetical protein BHW55_01685 [Candidatus Melainabacteria bacterium 35_41]CDE89654.1 predicted membrane protein [Clostridium sp. CAG:729]
MIEKLKKLKRLIPFLITIFVIVFFHYSRIYVLKFYPVITNSFIFIVFFSSLFCKETVIQKIAKKMDGELTDFSRNYTRNLTYVWCIFLFINLSISILTVFLPAKIWILYNGCISYIAIGLLFGVEYIVRITLRAKHVRK